MLRFVQRKWRGGTSGGNGFADSEAETAQDDLGGGGCPSAAGTGLTIFAERTASPSEIARELRLDVSNVGYHVTALAETNLIERVGSRPV